MNTFWVYTIKTLCRKHPCIWDEFNLLTVLALFSRSSKFLTHWDIGWFINQNFLKIRIKMVIIDSLDPALNNDSENIYGNCYYLQNPRLSHLFQKETPFKRAERRQNTLFPDSWGKLNCMISRIPSNCTRPAWLISAMLKQ